jgi:hypothetical protein
LCVVSYMCILFCYNVCCFLYLFLFLYILFCYFALFIFQVRHKWKQILTTYIVTKQNTHIRDNTQCVTSTLFVQFMFILTRHKYMVWFTEYMLTYYSVHLQCVLHGVYICSVYCMVCIFAVCTAWCVYLQCVLHGVYIYSVYCMVCIFTVCTAEINTENNIHCNKTKYTYKRQHTVCDINIICTIYFYTKTI